MDIYSRLRFVLCPGSLPATEHQETYKKIYECWSSVWKSALVELAGSDELHSDLFTRQNYVAAIFDGDVCFATSFFRWTNAELPDFKLDSYFKHWKQEHLNELCRYGSNIIVSSQFTVHPYARGKNLGFSGKDLMMGMVAEILLNSTADAMTGAARINRGVNDLCERWGAETIAKDVSNSYGEKDMDLYSFNKAHMLSCPPHPLKNLVRSLWKNRQVISKESIAWINDDITVKAA